MGMKELDTMKHFAIFLALSLAIVGGVGAEDECVVHRGG
jgi:hypothetical protein